MTQEEPNAVATAENAGQVNAPAYNTRSRCEQQGESNQEKPAYNTCSKTQARTLTQEVALQTIEVSGGVLS